MSRIKRLERLLLSINSKKHFTLKELAEEFQVSTRTIQRDLLSLMEMGLPIISEFGPHGGYRMVNDRILPPIGFTEMEASAILFSLQTFEEESFPFQIQSRSVANKLLHYLPDDAKDSWNDVQKRLFVQKPLPKHSNFAPVMLEAAIKQKIVTIHHQEEGTKLYSNIQPIGIYSENGDWYCPAYSYSLSDFHIFCLNDVLNAVINFEPMEVKDFSEITIHNWAAEIVPRSFLHLDADIEPEGISYCKSHPYLKTMLTIDENGAAHLNGQILYMHIKKFAEYLWILKGDIIVHSPQEIRQLHMQWSEEISQKYSTLLNM
ncbi:HTH domain-containing protein [Bacillus sp. NEB1478]|uniref:helix-turn-helix transcriptional regulator n=1 Tax=Bacillus sp. NEB1478 TaxID=3073816 RepID=UPI002872F6E3|nr:HTH domain-containing protein [Bacillus sp. NEB1478]WNB90762.1 HTH domain-containing protein [Bacillus sp. NEB1478]